MYTNIDRNSIEYISTRYGKFEVLNKDECNNLIHNAQYGDIYSQNKLVESTLAFIIKSAQELWCPGSEIDDLIQVGVIGCIKAINTFDITKGHVFITWAGTIIKNEIRLYLRQFRSNKRSEYLESILYEDNGSKMTFNNILYDYNASNFVEDIIENELIQNILTEISKLADTKRIIIECYFGLNGRDAMTQPELSAYLGISQGYISRIITNCMKDIKNTIIEGEANC